MDELITLRLINIVNYWSRSYFNSCSKLLSAQLWGAKSILRYLSTDSVQTDFEWDSGFD